MSSTLLELAISMIFLYLMLSAASSAIQEIIANLFRWRAKTLEKGIEGLFNKDFKEEFYKLPLIESLCSPDSFGKLSNRPSYIAPATFALAVLDLAAKRGMSLPGGAAPLPVAAPTPAAPPNDPFAKPAELLRSLLVGAKDVDEQRKRIEGWFNDSMDRVSGWYKRTSHKWLWIIGVLVCILVNADSISLAKLFWNDPTLRAATVAAATEHVKNPPKEEQKPTSPSSPTPITTGAGTASGQATSSNDTAFKRLSDVRRELSKVNIPLGWCWYGDNEQKKCFPILNAAVSRTEDAALQDPRMIMSFSGDNILWWVLKVVGLLLTALAISQGAPFWFDLLQKAVNLRLAGNSPAEKQQKK